MEMRWRIEKFLRVSAMSATRFGRLAIGDPCLVHDLRRGRELRPRTIARLDAFLAGQKSAP
ncbi:hypothetical protein [Sphingomonas sp. M1-B02]|uniref:hypothetical protein n=1 Tax=Sphingomonas sp. M1-B02 TaxID=3114300 RepID=UPI0022407E8A|nr:hypothetical protein [Sphingomonas sp. S6-11]UZK66102.1 hypothetical protein OKW87_16585 [Sphingomonas sp. S6-11]